MNFGGTSLPPPGPTADNFKIVADLLALIADPQGAKARLDALNAATAEYRAVTAEHAAATDRLSSDRKAAEDAIANNRRLHEQQLAAERDKHHADLGAREGVMAKREAELDRLLAKAKSDATAAAKVRQDLEARLERVRSAAA